MFAIKVAILLLIFFGLAVTRFAVKISEAMPSNHMLGTTAIFMLFVDIGINAVFFYSFIKGSPYIKLSALLGLVIICKFVLTIVFSHDSIKSHASNLYPFSIVTRLRSLQSARRVNDDQKHFELHGLSWIICPSHRNASNLYPLQNCGKNRMVGESKDPLACPWRDPYKLII